MYQYQTTVKLHETDAAGLLFFAHQFRIAHDAYEAFMTSAGFGFATVLKQGSFLLPIVHASADFTAPLFVGDALTVSVQAEEVSEHSFVLSYQLSRGQGTEVGRARTVHVCLSMKTKQKEPLPEPLREALQQIKG